MAKDNGIETDDQKIVNLIQALSEAELEHKDACAEVDHAQGRKTAALNKLNGLQKDLTEAINKRCQRAPRETDWQRYKTQLVPTGSSGQRVE